MPNRIIKESICRSDTIDSLSWFEEVLFYRLIVVCDDYGRFDGRPAIIKGACFPLKDDITKKHILGAIDKLSTVGLVRGYEVRGRSYLQLTTWDCHQQIRATKSKYPSPDDDCAKKNTDDRVGNQLISDDINCNQSIPSESNCPRIRNRESRIENRNTETCAREAIEVRRFEDFWNAYPKKQRRYLAEKAYCDLILSGAATEDELVVSAKNYTAQVKDSRERVYLPNNFLEKCIFSDYLEAKPESGPPKVTGPEQEELIDDEEWWKYGPNAWGDGNV